MVSLSFKIKKTVIYLIYNLNFILNKKMLISPSSRKTFVLVDNNNLCLNEFYINSKIKKVRYSIFRQRIIGFKKRYNLTIDVLYDAIKMDKSEWISFYGGGKHKNFIYNGKHFTKYIGANFYSLSAFLRTIGVYDKYSIIKSRLLRNWDIDKAILHKSLDTSKGRIYVIRCKINKLVYVGQTVKTINERFDEHLNSYKSEIKSQNTPSRLLFQAFDKYGIENFEIELLEDDIPNAKLAERENYWIKKLNSMDPKFGLNMVAGVSSSVGYGKQVTYMGKTFNSLQQAVREYSKIRPDCPPYIIAKRIKKNKRLPRIPRKQSKNPDAGTIYWRKWKNLVNRGNVCKEWSVLENDEGYNNFKNDMGFPPSKEYKLGRIDITKTPFKV